MGHLSNENGAGSHGGLTVPPPPQERLGPFGIDVNPATRRVSPPADRLEAHARVVEERPFRLAEPDNLHERVAAGYAVSGFDDEHNVAVHLTERQREHGLVRRLGAACVSALKRMPP